MTKLHPLYRSEDNGAIYRCGGKSWKWFGESACLGFDCETPVVDLQPVWGDPDLQCWAAHEASKVLVQNWRDALSDGSNLEDLLPDVDQVIAHLQTWANEIREQFVKEAQP